MAAILEHQLDFKLKGKGVLRVHFIKKHFVLFLYFHKYSFKPCVCVYVFLNLKFVLYVFAHNMHI